MSLLTITADGDGYDKEIMRILDCGQGRYKILEPDCGGLEIFMCNGHAKLDVFVRARMKYVQWENWNKEKV